MSLMSRGNNAPWAPLSWWIRALYIILLLPTPHNVFMCKVSYITIVVYLFIQTKRIWNLNSLWIDGNLEPKLSNNRFDFLIFSSHISSIIGGKPDIDKHTRFGGFYTRSVHVLPILSVPVCCNPYHGIVLQMHTHTMIEHGYEFCYTSRRQTIDCRSINGRT